MSPTRCRPFTVLDAIVLVAATAVGTAVMRHDGWDRFELLKLAFGPAATIKSSWEMFRVTACVILGFQPLLLTLTLAFLILRLLRPRPPLRRLARQPGFAAACGVTLISLIDFLGRIPAWFEWWFIYSLSDLYESYIQSYDYFFSLEPWGAAVAAVWVVMALGQSGRPEPSWIDRGGRALGVVWLLLLALELSATESVP
jgi:hypothetical protein